MLLVDIDWEDMVAWYMDVQSVIVSYLIDEDSVVQGYVTREQTLLYGVDLLLDIDDIDVRNELWRMREVAMSYERVCRAEREFYRCLDEYCEDH